jgi:hypothetical protein
MDADATLMATQQLLLPDGVTGSDLLCKMEPLRQASFFV